MSEQNEQYPTRLNIFWWAVRRGTFFMLALSINLPLVCAGGVV